MLGNVKNVGVFVQKYSFRIYHIYLNEIRGFFSLNLVLKYVRSS